MKLLIGPYTVWQLISVRAVITAAILIPVILMLGGEHRLTTPYWRLYVLRGVLFTVGFSLFYAGFPYMTFANLVTIFFAAPLITAVLAVFFLGERIGLRTGRQRAGLGDHSGVAAMCGVAVHTTDVSQGRFRQPVQAVVVLLRQVLQDHCEVDAAVDPRLVGGVRFGIRDLEVEASAGASLQRWLSEQGDGASGASTTGAASFQSR